MSAGMTLDELRAQLDQLDQRVVELIADRQAIIGKIAQTKKSAGFPLRDYSRERQVLEGARANARRAGVSEEVAESVVRTLIRYSLTQQEQASVVAHRSGSGRRVLIIGGAGKMGRWFAQFLDSQGFDVQIADPSAPDSATCVEDWRRTDLAHDYIIVATPLQIAGATLEELAAHKPAGTVFDICSLKSPVRRGIRDLLHARVRVASIHPMFGPDVRLLSGRRVVFADTGDQVAMQNVRDLFAPTMAELVTTGLEEHDQLIAFILGLSHAVNIAFFTALRSSGESLPRLMELSSTTFDHQMEIARRVSRESPQLYYGIQKLNDYGNAPLDALAEAVEQLRTAVRTSNEAAFVSMMEAGSTYTSDRRRQPAARKGAGRD
jgi:chorismate mutase / prephenate dehydrogenase